MTVTDTIESLRSVLQSVLESEDQVFLSLKGIDWAHKKSRINSTERAETFKAYDKALLKHQEAIRRASRVLAETATPEPPQ